MGESGERKKSVWMGSKKMCLFDTVVLTFTSCAPFEKKKMEIAYFVKENIAKWYYLVEIAIF